MTNRGARATTLRIALRLIGDVFWLVTAGFQSRQKLAAENFFLRKWTLYIERRVKPLPSPASRETHHGEL